MIRSTYPPKPRSSTDMMEKNMLASNTKLAEFSKGQGGGHHQSPTRTLTPDGQRVVDWAKTLPVVDGFHRQQSAVCKAFTRMGLQVTDFMTNEEFNGVQAGNGPPRYDFHTGQYFDYGQGDQGVVICTDQTLLVAKATR
jgi:hypothetical protein